MRCAGVGTENFVIVIKPQIAKAFPQMFSIYHKIVVIKNNKITRIHNVAKWKPT